MREKERENADECGNHGDFLRFGKRRRPHPNGTVDAEALVRKVIFFSTILVKLLLLLLQDM